jgi:hypothetical protein
MKWGRPSFAHALLLGLLVPLGAADADAKGKAKADPTPIGSADGLVYEPIQNGEIYTDNATAQVPPVEGWWDSKICSGAYCVYANRRLAKGRGMAIVSKADEFQKLTRLEAHFDRGENKYFDDPVPFVSTEILEKGTGLTANKTLRRGKPLMTWSPVLLVHTSLFDDVPKKKDRTRLLEAAVSFLPQTTRTKFNTQRSSPSLHQTTNPTPKSIESILLAHPFEIDLGYATPHRPNQQQPDDDEGPAPHSKHYANFPETAVLQHDCRPNVAWHIDESFSLRLTVARKTQVGEELSVSYIDPFLARAERNAWVKRHRGSGGGCPCRACSPPGGEKGEEWAKGGKRLEEVLELKAVLRNHDSRGVTVEKVERFVKLFEEERLQVRLAEAYELAALNFNYLGEDRKAKKYADLAVQAGIVEGGAGSNDVVAMRVMAKDVKGHYSYQFTLKRRGLVQ